MALDITAAAAEPALLDLPWDIPLEEWPSSLLAALPRGISRHVVRFVNLSGRVLAVKEIGETVAHHEYDMLRDLSRLDEPSVDPVAVITGRVGVDGEELNAVLITEHLQFPLPYRALFSLSMREDTASRLIDALALLLVRLHLIGFYWGDVSLSNTLFRRDAGEFAAYLVDAETGELHPDLTPGQREYDVDLARTNIIGELMDLQAGGYFPLESDPIDVGDRIRTQYDLLWNEVTAEESLPNQQRQYLVSERIRRLNELGFDVAELRMASDDTGEHLVIQPKVVDAGHHNRKFMRLTGMDVGEHQARRLLGDIDAWRATHDMQDVPLEEAAHDWLTDVFAPIVRAIPRELAGKLEPAQLYHEYLEHRWYMAQQAGHDVPREEALASYITNILQSKRDEAVLLEPASERSSTFSAASHPDLW